MSKNLQLVGIIVPDVHEQIVRLQKLLAKYDPLVLWVLFLGDFMDTFKGLTWETHETARWLAENLMNPKYRFLWGNHDLHYAYPINAMICSGFNSKKLAILRNTFGEPHWKQFKLFDWVGTPASDEERGNVENKEYLVTHAGLHPYFIHPVKGWNKKYIADLEEEAMHKLRHEQNVMPILQCGRGRGGIARVGGVVWADWDLEFTPVEELNQICGHTPGDSVRTKIIRDKSDDKTKRGLVISQNYCLDTHLNHVLLVYEDGSLQIEGVEK